MGEVELKGLPEPMQAYCLGQEQLLDFAQGHADRGGATGDAAGAYAV